MEPKSEQVIAIPKGWTFTKRDFIEDFYPDEKLIPDVFFTCPRGERMDSETIKRQANLHLELLREFEPRPKFPKGLDPKQDNVAGLAPQYELILEALDKLKKLEHKRRELNMARMFLVSLPVGTGKSGLPIDLCHYKNGMPAWPEELKGTKLDGFPVILIVSANWILLEKDFVPYLRSRHPYFDPDVVQVLPRKVKCRKRLEWLTSEVERLRKSKKAPGILYLCITPQTLLSEYRLYSRQYGKQDQTLIGALLQSIRILVLDEADCLGTFGAATLGNAIGKTQDLMRKFNYGRKSGIQALVLAIFIAQMRDRHPHDHIVMAMSATLSRSDSNKALSGYLALAGVHLEVGATKKTAAQKKRNVDAELKFWRESLIVSHIVADEFVTKASVERCIMPSVSLVVHDAILENLLHNSEEDRKKTKEQKTSATAKKMLLSHCLSASLGPSVILESEASISVLRSLNADKLIEELKQEAKKVNPMVQRAGELVFERLQQQQKGIVFYTRQKQAHDLVSHFATLFHVPPSDILVLAGSKKFEGCRYSPEEVRDMFRDSTFDDSDEEFPVSDYEEKKSVASNVHNVLIMSKNSSSGRGQNLGFGSYAIMMGQSLDPSDFPQAMGRIFRAGCIGEKEVIQLLPQKEFLVSEVICALNFRGMCNMSDFQHGEVWGPLLAVGKEFAKLLQDENSSSAIEFASMNHDGRKDFASTAYAGVKSKWKGRQSGAFYSTRKRKDNDIKSTDSSQSSKPEAKTQELKEEAKQVKKQKTSIAVETSDHEQSLIYMMKNYPLNSVWCDMAKNLPLSHPLKRAIEIEGFTEWITLMLSSSKNTF